MDLNKYIDFTNLKKDGTSKDIAKLCQDAMKYGFEAVCVYPCYVTLAKEFLEGSTVKVCTVIGYPDGMNGPKVKSYEAIDAIEMGADEIEMVINHGALIDKDYDYIKAEIEEIRDSIDGKTLKVIVEPHLLDKDDMVKITEICSASFVNYIEIYNSKKHKENNVKDVTLINEHKNEALEVKVNGHLKTEEDILELINLGVTRVAVSKISKLIEEEK